MRVNKTKKSGGLGGLLKTLSDIKIGGSKTSDKLKRRDKIYILRNISTLVESGLSLPKAMETLAQEKTLKKHRDMLITIRQKIEHGESFSSALARFTEAFGEILIQQVRVGEKSGTLPATLAQLVSQLEQSDDLKSKIIKKLSYPAMLLVAGSGALIFMILYVIPTFEKTYEESGAVLPAITRFLIGVGHFGSDYGLFILVGAVAFVFGIVATRRNDAGRLRMDRLLLKMPVVGDFLRNLAVLQFMEILGNLMEAGFTVVDALQACSRTIGNRAVRKSVEELHHGVLRGERFSSELEKHGSLFPPVVNQLVIVGEKTGTLAKSTKYVRTHLQREVERRTDLMVGAIEPIMTLGMAAAIGTILLAIYLPMFDMIGQS
ncbi:MAG: type II secretion system F family protein [Planctomycetes bacterium]|nr:type II secretion system F family protein [Planctomycetota bacterium]